MKLILSTPGWRTSAAPAVSPRPGRTLTTPAGKPTSSISARQVQRGQRRVLGGLEHDGVARGERRAELPDGDQRRRVPGRDRADHADRLADRVRLRACGRRAGSGVTQRPSILSAQPAKWRKTSIAFGMSTMRGSKAGLPTSMRLERDEASRGRARSRRRAGTAAGRDRRRVSCDHSPPSNWARAAATAASTSAAPGGGERRERLLAGRRDDVERRAVGRVTPRAADEELRRRGGRDRPGRDAVPLAGAHRNPLLSRRRQGRYQTSYSTRTGIFTAAISSQSSTRRCAVRSASACSVSVGLWPPVVGNDGRAEHPEIRRLVREPEAIDDRGLRIVAHPRAAVGSGAPRRTGVGACQVSVAPAARSHSSCCSPQERDARALVLAARGSVTRTTGRPCGSRRDRVEVEGLSS